MKKMKLLITFLVVMLGVIFMSFTASASTDIDDSGIYYVDWGHSDADIWGLTEEGKKATSLNIPSILYHYNEAYRVIGVNIHSGNFKTITLPEGIREADITTCEKLESITIPKSVTDAGEQPFVACTSLKSITVDEDNQCYLSEGGVLFNKEKTVLLRYPAGRTATNYTIPNGVTIGYEAFRGCENLKGVTIPNSITSIDVNTFEGCTSLESVTLGNYVTSIGVGAFAGCTSLKSVTIPNGVTSIGFLAFSECTKLKKVIIGDNVTNVDIGAFAMCDNLKSVTIPANVTSIGEMAFGYDSNLEKIEGFTIYGYKNTAAETYANENGFIFIALDDEPHNHTYTSVVTAPTCTKDGYTTHTCLNCGYSYTDNIIPATGHDFGDWIVRRWVTCEFSGENYRICSKCGFEETQTISAFGHNFSETYTVDKAATCTEEGSESRHCSGCEKTADSRPIPAKGHSHTATTTAPTCTAEGYTTYTCSCGDTYTADETEETGHSYKAVVTAPTCTAEGYTTYTCSCGETYTADETEATGHSYKAVVTEPTCTAEGYTTYTCSCGDTYTADETEETGHSYGDDNICDNCGERKECSCNCHKTGIAKLFFNIINFFQKLFGQNKICACGAKH